MHPCTRSHWWPRWGRSRPFWPARGSSWPTTTSRSARPLPTGISASRLASTCWRSESSRRSSPSWPERRRGPDLGETELGPQRRDPRGARIDVADAVQLPALFVRRLGAGLEPGERRLRVELQEAVVAVDLDVRVEIGVRELCPRIEVLAEEDASREIGRPAGSVQVSQLERRRGGGAYEHQLVSQLQARIGDRAVVPECERAIGQELTSYDWPPRLRQQRDPVQRQNRDCPRRQLDRRGALVSNRMPDGRGGPIGG